MPSFRPISATAISGPPLSAFVEVEIIFPDADSIDGGWTNELDGTVLFSSIDETPTANDADYIKSSVLPVNDTCKISLSNPSAGVEEPFTVSYRYKKTSTATQVDLAVRLLEGATEIAAWSHTNISSSFVTVDQELTAPQFASISDFTNLFIEFTADT